ncbi:MAG: lysophospholipid acyltransferase family protein [Paludibacter sp.]|jgi:KDO2-lipid IV(A) lauroyltransferase|nr:lysophospholipid acyltransferase family protein [Paludibacter sp.]
MNKSKIKNARRQTVLALAFPFMIIAMLLLWICPLWLRKQLEIVSGKLYFKLGKKARITAIENLTLAFGTTHSDAQIEQLARSVFRNTAGAVLDFFARVYINKPKSYFKMVKVVGEENLRTAYERGKGVICLIPHISSWELSAVTPPMLGYKTIAASKPIKGYFIQKAMVYFRARRGMINIDRTGSYRNLVAGLNAGNCLILMIDQDTKVKGCFVDFFGKKAYTPLGAARLAADTGAAVVPMAMTRTDTGAYRFDILPEIQAIKTDDPTNDLVANTQLQTAIIENIIRQNPTQWVWMHRRWKTQFNDK